MRPDTVVREMEHAARTLTAAATYVPDALRRLSDASPGFPGGHVGSGDRSTQPENYEKTMGDAAVKHLAELEKALRTARRASDDLWGIVTKWGTRRDARDLEVADPADDMWCRSCLTIGHLAPRRSKGGVNCDWCAATLRELNQARSASGRKQMTAIPVQALQAHARGDRVYQRDLERWAGVTDLRRDRANGRKSRVLAPVVGELVAFGQANGSGSGSQFRSAVFCGLCGKDLGYAEGDTDATLNAETRRLQVEHTASEHGT